MNSIAPTGRILDLHQDRKTSSVAGSSGGDREPGDGHARIVRWVCSDDRLAACRRMRRSAGDRPAGPRPRAGAAALFTMSCGPEGTGAVSQRERTSLPGHRFRPGDDIDSAVGCAQYLTSHDAEYHAPGRRAGRRHRLHSQSQVNGFAPLSKRGRAGRGRLIGHYSMTCSSRTSSSGVMPARSALSLRAGSSAR